MKKYAFPLIVLVLTGLSGFSQEIKQAGNPDAETLQSPLKALTDQQYTALKRGYEMDMGKVAELNNYPSPLQVSRFAKELNLNPNQKIQLKKILDAWEFKTKEMGQFILKEETKLDNLFSSGKATDGSVIYFTNQLGLFTGELRNAHLQAHLKTRNILTPAQIKKYNTLMGYVN